MPEVYACPWFRYTKNGRVFCDGCRALDLPSLSAMQRYKDQYCLSITGWPKCTVSQACADAFEREHGVYEKTRRKREFD